MINLTVSHLEESLELIQALGLKIDHAVWIEGKDITGKGCILLKKDRIASAVKIAEKLMKEKPQYK